VASGDHTGRVPIIDNAVYKDGLRVATTPTLDETFETLAAHPGGFAWIGLYRPTADELATIADEFGLHDLAAEDAEKGRQRPKLERYGDVLFVVLRPARYLDEAEEVEFGELHLFIGRDFAITIRHAESPDLARVRRRLEAEPALLALGTEAVLYAVLDQVVDEYSPVLAGLENDIDEIEQQLFDGDPAVTRRIYDLSAEVMDFQRATRPLMDLYDALQRGFEKYRVHVELQRYLRDVHDHVLRVVDRGEASRQLLQNALAVHSTLVTQRQNEEMQHLTETSLRQSEEVKKISGWAAILFAPTLIATVYGMNFRDMPELDHPLGYPLSLVAMVAFGVGLYVIFKRRNWL
jgi:magnesium transporter